MHTKLSELSNRIASGLESIPNEATTITALVYPFVKALGYDVTNPSEFKPEYPCDFTPKGACADGAVIIDGKPAFLIECKKCGIPLSKIHEGQLRAYFNVHTSVKLGILTNGIEYRFYTDSTEKHIMDPEPFLSFDLSKPDSVPYNALKLFSKPNYTEKVFSRLSVVNRVKNDIIRELNHPYGELARLIFATVDLSAKPDCPQKNEKPESSYQKIILPNDGGIVRQQASKTPEYWMSDPDLEFTTNQAFDLVKSVAGELADRLTLTRYKRLSAVYLDNRTSKPICLLYLKNPGYRRISIDDVRYFIRDIKEISEFREEIQARLNKFALC